ncbi:MAG: hypothetical protein AAF721_01975 [Myxococcota bacterium]
MRTPLSLLLSVAPLIGCFSDGGPTASGASDDGSAGSSAADDEETGNAGDDTSDEGSSEDGADTTTDAATETGEANAAPTIVSLSADPPSISPGGTVTISAIVTDPDGAADLVGGTLDTSDAAQTYGPFLGPQRGVFTASVTWDILAELEAFRFAGDGTLMLSVAFFDTDGAATTDTVAVGLSCDGDETSPGVCGDGLCVDFDRDAAHCGECDQPCAVQAEDTMFAAGGCGGGTCQPLWDEACIVQSDPWNTCTDYCASQGRTCSPTCGDQGARARFLALDDCETFGVGAFSDLCDLAFSFGSGDDAYRCCCV